MIVLEEHTNLNKTDTLIGVRDQKANVQLAEDLTTGQTADQAPDQSSALVGVPSVEPTQTQADEKARRNCRTTR